MPFQLPSKTAELSDCGTYRYLLTRRWNTDLPMLGWIMLNPSTADADQDDPTIRRCIGFTRAWGFGGIAVRNLYGLRATDPRELWQHPDPVGPLNDGYLASCGLYIKTIAAWGADGERAGRGEQVRAALAARGVPLYHLGLTKRDQPKHPLYLAGTTLPVRWAS